MITEEQEDALFAREQEETERIDPSDPYGQYEGLEEVQAQYEEDEEDEEETPTVTYATPEANCLQGWLNWWHKWHEAEDPTEVEDPPVHETIDLLSPQNENPAQSPVYILFGETPCDIFENEGVEALYEAANDPERGVDLNLHCYTPPFDVLRILSDADGWMAWSHLTEEQYNLLTGHTPFYQIGDKVMCNGQEDIIEQILVDDPDGYNVELRHNGTQQWGCITRIKPTE